MVDHPYILCVSWNVATRHPRPNKDTLALEKLLQKLWPPPSFPVNPEAVSASSTTNPPSLPVFVAFALQETISQSVALTVSPIESFYLSPQPTVGNYVKCSDCKYPYGTKVWIELIQCGIRHTFGAEYHLLFVTRSCALSQIIFYRPPTPSFRLIQAYHGTLGSGFAGIYGNKGLAAFAVRVAEGNDDNIFDLCFTSAHLNPHAGEANRQRRDVEFQFLWKNVILNPVEGGSLRSSRYLRDCKNVIWMGDLNYRLRVSKEGIPALPRGEVDRLIDDENVSALVQADEFICPPQFQESPITFLPSYKFLMGSDNASPPLVGGSLFHTLYSTTRVPAYTDRILTSRGHELTCLKYTSCSEFWWSDHKPVCALIKIDSVCTQLMDELPVEPVNSWKVRFAILQRFLHVLLFDTVPRPLWISAVVVGSAIYWQSFRSLNGSSL